MILTGWLAAPIVDEVEKGRFGAIGMDEKK
jgi:hypothetical protein